jgi:hypothetical protein
VRSWQIGRSGRIESGILAIDAKRCEEPGTRELLEGKISLDITRSTSKQFGTGKIPGWLVGIGEAEQLFCCGAVLTMLPCEVSAAQSELIA